jgi:hypothetical protein
VRVTTLAPLRREICAVCGGGAQIAPGTACPVCAGTGMAEPGKAAEHRARMAEAALQGALARARRLGAAGVDLERQRAEQARRDAARSYEMTEAAARRAESALAQIKQLSESEQAARAEHAVATRNALEAMALTPFALPAPQPPTVNPLVPGGAKDPVIYADTITARQIDVWGSLNLAGGGTGLMTNPMTSTGDMIFSNPASTPVRLPVGAANQVLTVVGGVPTWQNSAAGFANPMTTVDDLILGGAAGVATRLAVGASGMFLSVNPASGHVIWGEGPLTTQGDLLYSTGGQSARLPIGTSGQVLTVSGSAPAWLTLSGGGGIPNVLTTKGDMVYSSGGSTAARLPIGSASQVLQVAAGIPSWTSLTTTVIQPSGDATGVTDSAAINAANTAFDVANTGGRISLGPGTFYINAVTISAQTVPGTSGGSGVSVWGTGSSTIVNVVGNGIGISCHRTSGYGAQFGLAAQMTTSSLKYFVLDGTLTTAGGIGLDFGDGWGYDVDLTVVNFTAANTIAVNQINRVFWTEKAHVKLNLMNNLQPLILNRTVAGDHSAEYNHYELYIFINTDNAGATMYNGVQFLGGMNGGGVDIEAHGNVSALPAGWNLTTNPIALFSFIGSDGSGDWSRTYGARLKWKIEQNSGVPNTGNYPYQIYLGSNNNAIKQTSGAISYTGGNAPAGNANGGEFSFDGPILGDAYLSGLSPGPPGSTTTITGQPPFPGYGVSQQNYGPNANVSVSGGGVTGVTISGQATGMVSSTFFLLAGASIVVNGAGANPTVYSWAPASASTF